MKHHVLAGLAALAIASIGFGCQTSKQENASAPVKGNGPAQVISMAVTSQGFVPAEVHVKAGQPVKLVVTRTEERTCATDIVIQDYGIRKALPLNQPVEVEFTPQKSGKVRYACAMDMIAGVLVVQ
jgi:plastocyanin domain-containing protein